MPRTGGIKKPKKGIETEQLYAQYIKALIETIRSPFLILDAKLRVVEANQAFYRTFMVSVKETEKKSVYKLGNGQWNIPALKKLLEDVLPAKKTVNDYEVDHNFPNIGAKIMLLNANQVDSMALILVAFEDVTAERALQKTLAQYTKDLEKKIAGRTEELSSRLEEVESLNKTMVGREIKMMELKTEIERLKKIIQKSNSRARGT